MVLKYVRTDILRISLQISLVSCTLKAISSKVIANGLPPDLRAAVLFSGMVIISQ